MCISEIYTKPLLEHCNTVPKKKKKAKRLVSLEIISRHNAFFVL